MKRIGVFDVPVEDVTPSRWQPRQRPFDPMANEADGELLASVKEHGILNRLIVFRTGDGERWELIAGHRRLAAARLAGLETVPVEQVFSGDMAALQAMVIWENLQREDLSAIEEAQAYRQLMVLQGLTQAEVAERIGKTQGHVSQRLSLLGMAPAVQKMIMERTLDSSVAREMAGMPVDLQEPVAMRLTQAMDKGETTSRKAANLARKLREAAAPEFWALPADMAVTPEQRNLTRLVEIWIERARAEGKFAKVIMETLDSGELLHPWKLEEWNATRICQRCGCAAGGDAWPATAREKGWTCATCQVKPLGFGADGPVGEWYRCRGTDTCLLWVGAEDPLLMALNHSMQMAAECRECQRRPALHSRVWWCQDGGCYVKAAKRAMQAEVERTQAQKVDRVAEGMARAAAWLEMQSGMDLVHWLAQPCARCMNLAHGEACELARHPPEYGSLQLEFATATLDDVTVPRCSRFRLRAMALVPDGSHLSAEVLRGLVVGLAATDRGGNLIKWLPFGSEHEGRTHGPEFADWLVQQGLDAYQLMWLLTMAVSTAMQPHSWELRGRQDRLGWGVIDPQSGRIERWMLAEVKIDGK